MTDLKNTFLGIARLGEAFIHCIHCSAHLWVRSVPTVMDGGRAAVAAAAMTCYHIIIIFAIAGSRYLTPRESRLFHVRQFALGHAP